MAYQDVCGSPVREVFGHAGRWAPVARPSGLCRNGPSPRRQLRNRKTDRWNHAGRDDASGCVSLGRCAQIGARRQLRGPVTFASGCRATVFEPNVPPSLGTAARARFGLGLPFLREGAGRDRRSEGNLQNRCAVCQNHACRGAGRSAGSSLGKMRWRLLQRTGGDSRPTTPSARVPPVVVYDIVTCLLREAASGVVVAGGNSSAAIQEGNHACRGTWMRAVASSGAAGRLRSPGACSRAATCENQRFAPVVAWMRPTAPSGTGGQLQAPGIILQRRHAPCDNPPFATPTCHQPLRAAWCAHILFGGCDPSVGRALRSPPFGRCDVKPRAPVPSLGRCDVTPCAPASRPCLSWEAGWRRCAATAPSYAEGGAVTLRGP